MLGYQKILFINNNYFLIVPDFFAFFAKPLLHQ
jgi:hypothetical protein